VNHFASNERRLTADQAAAMAYRLRRYLADASEAELVSRTKDIAANSYTFTRDGKIGILPQGDVAQLWNGCMTHVAVESEVRRRDPLLGFNLDELVFTKSNLDAFRQQHQVLSFAGPGPVFCRYGRADHMDKLYERGAILLRAASYYSSKALDVARRDDELVLRTYLCPHDFDLGIVAPDYRELLPERCFAHIDHTKPTDFYLLCVTAGFELRLFADFKANACLVVHDQAEFERRLMRGFRDALPGWHLSFAQARYLDPYNMPRPVSDHGEYVFFCKHFGYMYQREWRLVGRPPQGENGPFQDREVSIGSLTDISQVVRLHGDPFGENAPLQSAGAAG
jgi:hypothetical protein